jgi:ferric-dicitrate binding protein FerR (iron transport regulator)
MNPEQNRPVTDLLAKYLAGEANAEEAFAVDEWLQDEANKREFDRLVKLWNHLPQPSLTQTAPADEVWKAVSAVMDNKPVTQVKKLNIYRYVAAAAVIGIIVVLSFVWTRNGTQDQQASSPEYITRVADGRADTHKLTDGSVVTINSGSSLVYTRAFNTSNREVVLKGEAYFDVVADESKPFIIHIENLDITVVGTSFNVRSLPGAQMIEVQVQSGIVRMSTANTEMLVHKGETGRFDKNVGSISLINELDLNSLGYATKTFSFNDIPLPEACRYLENAFNITFSIDENKFRECRLTAHFENQPLSHILEVIDATLNTKSLRTGNTINIEGDGCR